NLFPHSKTLWETYIKVLAKQGKENEMISTWEDYVEAFPEERTNRQLVETLAWGVIDHASHSSSPLIRMLVLFTSFLSQDAKGVEILHRSLRDSNSAIRLMAVELVAHLGDDDIKDAIYQLFREESVWDVKLEVIRTLGTMKIKKAQDELLYLLQNSKTT